MLVAVNVWMHWRQIEKNDLEAVAGCRSRRSAGLAARTARRRPPVAACKPLRSPALLSGARTLGLGAAAQVALVARLDCSHSAAAARQGKGNWRRGDGPTAEGEAPAEVLSCPYSLCASTRPQLHEIGSLRIRSGRL